MSAPSAASGSSANSLAFPSSSTDLSRSSYLLPFVDQLQPLDPTNYIDIQPLRTPLPLDIVDNQEISPQEQLTELLLKQYVIHSLLYKLSLAAPTDPSCFVNEPPQSIISCVSFGHFNTHTVSSLDSFLNAEVSYEPIPTSDSITPSTIEEFICFPRNSLS